MTRRYAISSVIVLALVALALLYVANLTLAPLSRQSTVSLRLKWLYDPGFAGEMVAAKAGIFAKYGLQVEIRPGGFESDPIKLVASGSDTIGVAGADSFLIARSKGIPIVAFAAGYLETGVAYYVHADSGIASPSDFIGKRVGYQAGQDTATVYEALLRKARVDRQRINEIPVRFDFTPFLQRQVDVWPGYEATQAYILEREKVAYKQLLPRNYGISFIGTVYFTTEDYIAKQPNNIAIFTKALIEGWNLTYADYTKSITLIESYDPQSLMPDLIRFNLDRQKHSILPPGFRTAEFTAAQWNALQNILIDAALLEKPIDLTRAVTYEFLRGAYQN